jgi:hypothetical protein
MKLEIFLYLLTIFEFKFFINFLLTKILLHYENFTNTVLWCKGSPVPCLPTGRESGLPDQQEASTLVLAFFIGRSACLHAKAHKVKAKASVASQLLVETTHIKDR